MDNLEYLKEVEKSIQKKYKKKLWRPFCKAINQYELVKPGDKIAVCISGGKDSMLMAKLFQELKRHNKFEFELVFMVMDRISLILVIIGALNWGGVGLFAFDCVAFICGGQLAALSRIIYALVGIAGLWCITMLFRESSESN